MHPLCVTRAPPSPGTAPLPFTSHPHPHLSLTCAAVQTSYINPARLANSAPGTSNWGADWDWLSSVSTVAEFDEAFKNYLEASDNSGFRYQMQDAMNCWSGQAGTWSSSGVSSENKTGPVFQYQQTALCSIMVGADSSLECGQKSESHAARHTR